MSATRAERLIQLDQHRQAELRGVGRDEHDACSVSESDDSSLAFSPSSGWTDAHLDLLTRPEMLRRLESDRCDYLEMPREPTQEAAVARLARLALRHAGFWGHPPSEVQVPHPRWALAVEAAGAAADKQQALEAAAAILDGPEAAQAFKPVCNAGSH